VTKKPVWLDKELILTIHREQLAEHGGGDGLRDEGLLESALMRSENIFHYGEANGDKPSIYQLAAAYAYGIAKNHPFVDGNKRTAYVACFTFLRLNGRGFKNNHEGKLNMMLGLAAGEVSEADFAAWLHRNCQAS